MPSVKNFNPPAEVATEVEQWQHQVAGETYINRFDNLGNTVPYRINGRKVISVTPMERRMHENACVNEGLNPYRNGRLAPVRLLDSEPDTAELKANPNSMTEPAMKALFNSQTAAFTKKVGAVTNPLTLKRLREIADEVDAKASQLRIIDARVEELAPTGTAPRVNVFDEKSEFRRQGVSLSGAR